MIADVLTIIPNLILFSVGCTFAELKHAKRIADDTQFWGKINKYLFLHSR